MSAPTDNRDRAEGPRPRRASTPAERWQAMVDAETRTLRASHADQQRAMTAAERADRAAAAILKYG